jgi:hypothetical protein
MSMFISRIVRFAAQRIVFSPQARAVAAKAARGVADEVRLVSREKDKAHAAGRSVRRAISRLQGQRDDS